MKPVPFDDQMGLLSAHRKEMMIEIEMEETTTTKIYKSPPKPMGPMEADNKKRSDGIGYVIKTKDGRSATGGKLSDDSQ